MSNSIDEFSYRGKPGVHEVRGYYRKDGTHVDGYERTNPNETTADNLGIDVDKDGIPGAYDWDADGDNILDIAYLETGFSDVTGNTIEQAIDIDGDGIVDVITNIGSFLADLF